MLSDQSVPVETLQTNRASSVGGGTSEKREAGRRLVQDIRWQVKTLDSLLWFYLIWTSLRSNVTEKGWRSVIMWGQRRIRGCEIPKRARKSQGYVKPSHTDNPSNPDSTMPHFQAYGFQCKFMILVFRIVISSKTLLPNNGSRVLREQRTGQIRRHHDPTNLNTFKSSLGLGDR